MDGLFISYAGNSPDVPRGNYFSVGYFSVGVFFFSISEILWPLLIIGISCLRGTCPHHLWA